MNKGYLLNRPAGIRRAYRNQTLSLEDSFSSLSLTRETTWRVVLVLRKADMLYETRVLRAQTDLQLTASIFATLGTLLSVWKTVFKWSERPIKKLVDFCSMRRRMLQAGEGGIGTIEMEPLTEIVRAVKVEGSLSRELADLRAFVKNEQTLRIEKEDAMMQTIEQLRRTVAELTGAKPVAND